MDLNKLIETLYKANEGLARSRHAYLMKEAERKHYEARLLSEASGKSHSEKLTIAQSSDDWLKFHKELARLESIYQFDLFKYRILESQFQATYLQTKQDGEHMKRTGAEDERGSDYR